ncbi:mechanosensitive ion channel domain-containing protein [Rhodopirellula baltica]|uniref:MscS Mechanosensitive ion channel n=1 Tax=Rhodopirellula baltica WH47 TaxID=991778 RepID=F2APE8_RHOBT|nr:mechanosensitive ion channel domain-containing protein [Rhodopirellula baltica]EGF28464.1 MscS Mechanosensitive ion channel [Rhodopirellula baltica WH47]
MRISLAHATASAIDIDRSIGRRWTVLLWFVYCLLVWLTISIADAQEIVWTTPKPPPFTSSNVTSSTVISSGPGWATQTESVSASPGYTEHGYSETSTRGRLSPPEFTSNNAYTSGNPSSSVADSRSSRLGDSQLQTRSVEKSYTASSEASPLNLNRQARTASGWSRTDSDWARTASEWDGKDATEAKTVSYPLLPRQRGESEEWRQSPYADMHVRAAQQSEMRFRSLAQTSDPIAADIAVQNADLVQQWIELATSYNQLATRLYDAKDQLDATRSDYEDVHQKLTRHGLTPTIGLLLRHKKDQLDQWQIENSQTALASEALGKARQKQLELDLIRLDGSDPEQQAAQVLGDVGYDANRYGDPLRLQVEELLRQRAAWIRSLQVGYQDQQQKISELDSIATASQSLATDYRMLIDRHVMWIRSDEPIGLRDARNLKGGMAALFDSNRSADFGPTFERKISANPVGAIGLLVGIVLILVLRWIAKSWLVAIGSRRRMRKASPNKRKLYAGVLTVLVAAGIPAVLFWIGRWLGTGVVSEATLHAASAFCAGSLVAWLIEVPRQWLRADGYLDQHVDIELPRRPRAMKYLTIIGMGLVIAAYTITLMSQIDHGMWRGSVARVGFILAMLLVGWTMHLALRPVGGFLEPLIEKYCGSVIHRGRFLMYFAGIGLPLFLIGLSALGYSVTTHEIIQRIIFTAAILMSASILWAGVKYVSAELWHLLTGTRGATQTPGDSEELETGRVAGALGEHFLELKHHLAFLCQCALALGAIVCFGWLWIDVFPNVRMGNPVLWTVEDTVQQASVNATGQTVMQSVVETTPVTAMNLLLAAGTLFVAFQLAKLLPALFDALVLQRVSFDEGMEHFTLVLGRFLLFSVGCFIACKWIGVRWHTIQWLAVGLMIGLGFGLQDMVRNLFGGFIVLFEKPARLGDLITVGNFTGRVAAQRLRTTVLSDDDGREVIIPNKNFVSDDVVNWMGAGRLCVIPMEVAVTRDERPADLCRTLQELMIEQPDVLLTPAPQATLVCVGQRSQRIEVRAWIEQGQNAERYRDQLLKLVRRHLLERNLLAQNQPSQPEMRDVLTKQDDSEDFFDDDFGRPRISDAIRKRKRRA